MAVFKDKDVSLIGPVRSSRHYFLDYALESDAIYAHYGWSTYAPVSYTHLDVYKRQVLTNPPFGDGRKYEVKTDADKKASENYEVWEIAKDSNSIDMGLIFLENAYRILKENGRLGIILSNSLASVETVSYTHLFRWR